jgi:hypothetical protein
MRQWPPAAKRRWQEAQQDKGELRLQARQLVSPRQLRPCQHAGQPAAD